MKKYLLVSLPCLLVALTQSQAYAATVQNGSGVIDANSSAENCIGNPLTYQNTPRTSGTIYYTAQWEINHYDLTYAADTHCGTAPESVSDIEYGASQTLESVPTPDTGYSSAAWSCVNTDNNNTSVSINNNGQITMPAGNVTCTATCTANDYTVTYACGTGGSGSQTDSNNPYHVGDTVTVMANTGCTGPSGSVFRRWSCNQNVGNKTGGQTFTMPAANVKCTAQWTTCGVGQYVNGDSCANCPDGYTSEAGASAITECYKEGSRTGISQDGTTTPPNCEYATWASCTPITCTWKAYSNAAGTGVGRYEYNTDSCPNEFREDDSSTYSLLNCTSTTMTSVTPLPGYVVGGTNNLECVSDDINLVWYTTEGVEFNDNPASCKYGKMHNEAGGIAPLTVPTREGYRFTGWKVTGHTN